MAGGKKFRSTGRRVKSSRLRAAVELGRRGGNKGGPARAKTLTGSKRKQIASHAAKKRWGKNSAYTKPAFYKRKVR
jgi:hypothetical protein